MAGLGQGRDAAVVWPAHGGEADIVLLCESRDVSAVHADL